MTLNKQMIRTLRHQNKKVIPKELEDYLLVHYGDEPFPHTYDENSLYRHIFKSIEAYEAGTLDVSLKSPEERWQDEKDYLQDLYIENLNELRNLEDYVIELERIIFDRGFETQEMIERQKIPF